MNNNKAMESLKKICTPVCDYLKDNYNPHCTVIITDNEIKLVEDKICIPVRSDD
ncbi:hypothetical protein [Clostridium scatologenes]|uniref:Uncharacterized protein n=1 Tax=Clostridium scatologenes TaxID=1548 RepID=A0A0E3JY10_CLOSL|nr:hypothetical protein [Clostridium scatologenes]AKA68499.1 hypothetical protein CSCA_1374 [Clostridium scatologenes]